MSTITETKAKPVSIPVGFQWRSVGGKEWVVTGLLPGGVCKIHQVGRYVSGEMYSRDIRAGLGEGRYVKIDTTDEARAILRRCNFR